MTRACHGPVRAATGGAFSDEEIDDVLSRLEARFQRAKGRSPNGDEAAAMAEAAGEMTREAVMDALIARRLEAAAAKSRAKRQKILAALPGDEGQKRIAYNVGSEKQGLYSAYSVDAQGRAAADSLLAEVDAGLRAEPGLWDRISNVLFTGEKGFDRLVAKELARLRGASTPATGDRGAEIAARVFAKAQDRAKAMQNAAGAWIGDLEGWVARQHHDRLKISGGFWRELRAMAKGEAAPGNWKAASLAARRKAFHDWADFIRPRLDAKTFERIDPQDVAQLADAAELHAAGVLRRADDLEERFLYSAWWNIVTGGEDRLAGASDLGEFRPPPSTARSVSKSRVLHFKSADDWMDYHDRFGQGSLFGVIARELDRSARNAALMDRWGPAPEAAIQADLADAAKAARAAGDSKAAQRLDGGALRQTIDQLTGAAESPESLRLAIIGRTIRWDQSMSKLGGMVLSAMGSDQALAASAMKRAGGTWLQGYSGAFGGILRLQGAERTSAARAVDVGARVAMARLTGRWKASDGPLGWMNSTSRLFYRVNFFEAVADGQRHGMAAMLASHLGDEAGKPLSAVNAGTRETLERFGIGAREWDLIRAGAADVDGDGKFLAFDALDAIPDDALLTWRGLEGEARSPAAAAAAREDLGLRLRALFGDFVDNTLTEPRAREAAALTLGTRSGTVLGEVVRSFMQFWSFPVAVLGRHVAPAMAGYAGQVPVALLAHLIAASTLGGYFSLQAKQIAKGRTPREILEEDGSLKLIEWSDDPDEPGFKFGRAGSVWIASLLQGGGLGIYGDFLFGEVNRAGRGFGVSALAGPAIGEFESLAQIVRSAISGDVDDAPAELFRFGVRNTPFANLWYARWALDYAVLFRVQEALSPGYLQRYEDRVRDREGSDFLIDPSEAVL
ncbi:MAG TPA: hypothetical protein VEA44_05260 [Caulobacter sp.]|nr:hypothetical protein [Caulobacter sp.]